MAYTAFTHDHNPDFYGIEYGRRPGAPEGLERRASRFPQDLVDESSANSPYNDEELAALIDRVVNPPPIHVPPPPPALRKRDGVQADSVRLIMDASPRLPLVRPRQLIGVASAVPVPAAVRGWLMVVAVLVIAFHLVQFGWQSLKGVMAAQSQEFLLERRGSVAVEFAMILPILLTLLMGGLNYGMAVFTYTRMDFAVESAARCWALDKCHNEGDATNYATARASIAGVSFTAADDACGRKVSGTFDFNLITMFPVIPLNVTACYPV